MMPEHEAGPTGVHETGPSSAELLACLHAEIFPPAERWQAQAFREMLAVAGTQGWISLVDGEPTGLLLTRLLPGGEGEILTLGVRPAFRRRGQASSLLQAFLVCPAVEAPKTEKIFLEVSVNNRAALALYGQLGFRQAGLRQAYYPDGSDACVMCLEELS
ncbi:GNAT family N-acetyltransferase [Oecophyllibacter saccharovorans]|uniref:GNAT family N-acetyltransferase n=1 Tax=Oecophyllibacter saccharovorans TaxID=2558360 RepID=UPI001E2B4ABF|nr:N-acetyltransferase [Oecophyllibacter saccharovorans]